MVDLGRNRIEPGQGITMSNHMFRVRQWETRYDGPRVSIEPVKDDDDNNDDEEEEDEDEDGVTSTTVQLFVARYHYRVYFFHSEKKDAKLIGIFSSVDEGKHFCERQFTLCHGYGPHLDEDGNRMVVKMKKGETLGWKRNDQWDEGEACLLLTGGRANEECYAFSLHPFCEW